MASRPSEDALASGDLAWVETAFGAAGPHAGSAAAGDALRPGEGGPAQTEPPAARAEAREGGEPAGEPAAPEPAAMEAAAVEPPSASAPLPDRRPASASEPPPEPEPGAAARPGTEAPEKPAPAAEPDLARAPETEPAVTSTPPPAPAPAEAATPAQPSSPSPPPLPGRRAPRGSIGYADIERRTREQGFATPERTVRFYVTEGVLPRPQDVPGAEPVFSERWILPTLKAIDSLRRRFGRSLGEIRGVVKNLSGDPHEASVLAEKLDVLWQEVVRSAEGGAPEAPSGLPELGPDEAKVCVERFFTRLLEGASPDELSILDIVRDVEEGRDAARRAVSDRVEESAKKGLSAERARSLEELYIGRFDETMARVCRIPHPIDEALYPAGPRDRIHLKRTRADEIIDLMKRHRIYDRELLDALPLDEVSEYRVFTRSIFGRKDVRVVVAAASVSPLEELIVSRRGVSAAGPVELDRALEAIAPRDGSFYYVGILSSTGWAPGTEHHLPSAPNLLVCLVEPASETEWRVRSSGDERWSGLWRLFDPESEREKVDRARRAILEEPELQLRGGHVLIRSLRERLNVTEDVLVAAISEVVRQDADLVVQEVAGREILKRRRI